jgi:FkbM family methyltransferase
MALHGLKIELSPMLFEYSPELMADRYETGTRRLFEKIVRPGMTVMDCGAHIGWYTLIAAERVGSSGRVYAFEPNPKSYDILLRNIALNGLGNVVAIRKALAEKSGSRFLYPSKRESGTDSLFKSGLAATGLVVEATTLDDFLAAEGWPHVHLIKMDIEGAELAALEGAHRFLRSQNHISLIVEFSPRNLQAAGVAMDDFLRRLQILGFRIQVIRDRGEPLVFNPSTPPLSSKDEGYVNLLCQR